MVYQSRDPQVHRALFWAKSLKGGKLSDFVGDLSAVDVFSIAIAQCIFLIRSSFSLNLRLVQIIRA